MRAVVYINLKEGILDPQGKVIQQALSSLGFTDVNEVRLGKYIELELNDIPKERTQQQLQQMCEQLLANPVIEDYRFEIINGVTEQKLESVVHEGE